MKATKTGARSRMNIPAEKRPESKAVSYACILVIFFAIISVLILKVVQTSALGGILGNDFRFHYALAQEYNQGKNALFSDTAITVNGGPYPPLYHMIMVVMMQFGILEQFSILLQTIGFPLVIAIMAYLAYRQMGLRTAAMTSAILLSSVAMFDRSQAIPQMLDMIFFPLAIYFLMKERKWPYIACMLIPIYAHGMWALLFFGGMTLYTLFRRKYISYNVWVLALSLPIIIMTAWYLPGYLGVHGGAPQSDQEVYASEPSFFMDYLGFAIAIVAIAFIVYLVVKSARQKRFAYRFTELEILCLFWLLAMM
ncbi:hypothetical protein KY363_02400, partial [Candidatus Woesearchaeota archaeon]|nr:hypothetical protein [Candidatus Woesearchaeota archaeon]